MKVTVTLVLEETCKLPEQGEYAKKLEADLQEYISSGSGGDLVLVKMTSCKTEKEDFALKVAEECAAQGYDVP